MALQEALKAAPFTLADVAQEAGLSLHTIRAYAYGKRVPDAENAARVVRALRKRAERITRLAEKLEREADR